MIYNSVAREDIHEQFVSDTKLSDFDTSPGIKTTTKKSCKMK